MAPTDTDCLLSSLPTEAPVLRTKPALRSAGPVTEVELPEDDLLDPACLWGKVDSCVVIT
jgi:hypothetical protein